MSSNTSRQPATTSSPKSYAETPLSEILKHKDEQPEWLVENLIVCEEVGAILAPAKTGKTLLAVDLAISMASGKPWLARFQVPKPRRILYLTGETNQRRLASLVGKICTSKGLSPSEMNSLDEYLKIEFVEFPLLKSPADIARLRQTLERYSTEVLILDPLYLAIQGVDTAKVQEVGPLLWGLKHLAPKLTPIVVHHVTKSSGRGNEGPTGLYSAAGAGFAEAVGQWINISRTGEFRDGVHQLNLSIGGRDQGEAAFKVELTESSWECRIEKNEQYTEDRRLRKKEKRDKSGQELLKKNLLIAESEILALLRESNEPRAAGYIETCVTKRKCLVHNVVRKALGTLEAEKKIIQVDSDPKDRRKRGFILSDYAQTWEGQLDKLTKQFEEKKEFEHRAKAERRRKRQSEGAEPSVNDYETAQVSIAEDDMTWDEGLSGDEKSCPEEEFALAGSP
ncbi:MAG: AAA family ATPase [Planctomyces sp.]|nr:AAA family ATPase [Planctomyces sp.]